VSDQSVQHRECRVVSEANRVGKRVQVYELVHFKRLDIPQLARTGCGGGRHCFVEASDSVTGVGVC